MEENDNQETSFEPVTDEEIGGLDAAALTNKIKKLKQELKSCQTEKTEYLAGWQRAKADYLNLKKEEESKRAEIGRYAKADLLNDLIRLADSFEMAFANQTAWQGLPENWRKGVEYIHEQLLVVFRDHGLEELNPLGEAFDPARDQSLEVIPTDQKSEDGKILAVVKKGYRLNGRVIRPAQVKIGEYQQK